LFIIAKGGVVFKPLYCAGKRTSLKG